MAGKKPQEEALRKGLEALAQTGLAVDGASPVPPRRLAGEFGKSKEVDLAVAYTLGRMADSAAAETLAALEKQTADKAVKKEIKRAFFKLSQRGLTVGREEKPDHEGISLFGSGPSTEAYMSAVDGGGSRLIWIAKPQPNRGLQVIQAMLHDREGLLRIGGAQITRKELRKMAADIQRQHGVTMVSVPWPYADYALYQGYETAKARNQAGLENFHELRSIIATGKPKEPAHPIYDRLDPTEAREGAWREASRRLLDEAELRYWIITEDWLQAFLPLLQEAQSSRLVLNPVQKEERFSAIVRDAVKALCDGEIGKSFRRRMEDMALYFFETGRAAQANLSLAVALQIREGGPGPLDISFLTALVQKSFAFFLSQEKQKKEEEPSLIIKP